MTYNELKAAVASLGFERSVGDEDGFFRATERALVTIFTDLGEISVTRIYLTAPRLTSLYKEIRHRGGGRESFTLCGRVFSFRPHGNGSYTLSDGNTATRVTFKAADGVVKAIFNGSAEITFEGEYDYTVTSLAAFDDIPDPTALTVSEYSERRTVDLTDYIGDLDRVADTPVCVSGNMKGLELSVRGSLMYLPFSLYGEVEIEYYRLPHPPHAKDAPLDIPSGAAHLLSLLVAAFIWLDDDAEKAQYYMALYRDGLAAYKHRQLSQRDKKYHTNGWA